MATVTMPTADVIKAGLMQIDADDGHRQDNLHPLLVKLAGQTKDPKGVLLLMVLAFQEYTKELLPIAMESLLEDAPGYLRVLIGHDAEANRQAEQHLKTVIARANAS